MFNARRAGLALALILPCFPALAQTYHDTSGTIVPGVVIVDPTDNSGPLFSSSNPGKVSATVNASVSGFAPGGAYATPLAVSTTSARVALPTGTVVVVYNTGSSTAYVILGSSSATATTSGDVVPAGGWMAFTVGSNAYLAAITASGTTSLNISGGSGLPTGAAGVGSGGGGGTVAQGTAASASGAWPEYLTLGGSAVGATNGIPVTPATGASFAVTGTFWQATQPVSAASLPLPSGAATAANQTSVQSSPGTSASTALTIQGSASGVALPAMLAPQTSGGFSKYHVSGLAGTIQYVKTSAGQLARIQCDNLAGSASAWVELFDAASGAALGTSVVDEIALAAGGTGGFTLSGVGEQYSNGIAIGAATASGGSTAVSTAVNCNATYK